MQTKIQVKGTGLCLNDDGKWELELQPADDQADGFYVIGPETELAEFKKRLGKVSDAKLSIGAEDDVAGVDQVKAELEAANKDRKHLLAEVEQLKSLPAAAPQVLDVNHPVVKAARGHFTTIQEKAQVYSTVTKGSADQARYMELLREARDGLAKIAELVPAPKKNGHPEQQAPAAS